MFSRFRDMPEKWQFIPEMGGNFKTEWVAVLLQNMQYWDRVSSPASLSISSTFNGHKFLNLHFQLVNHIIIHVLGGYFEQLISLAQSSNPIKHFSNIPKITSLSVQEDFVLILSVKVYLDLKLSLYPSAPV